MSRISDLMRYLEGRITDWGTQNVGMRNPETVKAFVGGLVYTMVPQDPDELEALAEEMSALRDLDMFMRNEAREPGESVNEPYIDEASVISSNLMHYLTDYGIDHYSRYRFGDARFVQFTVHPHSITLSRIYDEQPAKPGTGAY
jgi:hypothetical protein